MNAINTPLKRVGFIIMVIGISLFFCGWLFWALLDFYYPWRFFIRSISFNTYLWFIENKLVAYGFYMSLVGLIMSYIYDIGIGKIVIWIKG